MDSLYKRTMDGITASDSLKQKLIQVSQGEKTTGSSFQVKKTAAISLRKWIAAAAVAAIICGIGIWGIPRIITPSTAKATDLMEGVLPNSIAGKSADDAFSVSVADFSMELFKKSIADKENSLISPLSVMLALAMTANGADGETLAQMEQILGGGIPLDVLNEYLYSYIDGLPSAEKQKLSIANSIWFRDDKDSLCVQAEFLQRNADYYSAAAYSSAFDSQTVRDINNWVKANTDKLIDKILGEINERDMLFLINAVIFDAEWQSVYNKEDVRRGDFTDINGAVRNVNFMHSVEYQYIDDGMATGFIKPYKNGGYSFVALLPNEDVTIQEYVEALTGAGFLDTLNNRQGDALVYASMPKFKYEYSIKMSDTLMALGIIDAFDEDIADFGRMGTTTVGNGNLYISEVLHKTYISVDELGTKAGAVTMVAVTGGGAGPIDPKIVNLDRPFVYAIIDNATNLTIFIGTLMTV